MTEPHSLIADALSPHDDLFERLNEIVTQERAFAYFKAIADVSGPTLTASYTRGPILMEMLKTSREEGLCGSKLSIDTNYLSSGNVVLSVGDGPQKPAWSMAHLDNICFLTGGYQNGCYALTAYCDPRQTAGRRPAHALAYDCAKATMTVIADGWLCYADGEHTFETDVTDLPPATRIVYQSSAEWDQEGGIVTGNIDDAYGCTGLVLAAMVLSHWDVQSLFVLTDEEEGVVVPGPPAFSRGASRLLNRLPPSHFPNLITISDHHEEVADLSAGTLDLSRFGQGALFGAFASGTKGGVTPPRLLAHQRAVAQYLADHKIHLNENPGYISRSDCVSAMMATPNVALIGFPGAYSHFIDTPRAHIDDLVNLAKSLVVLHLLAQNPAWRAAALG